jgi:hypothetical protein
MAIRRQDWENDERNPANADLGSIHDRIGFKDGFASGIHDRETLPEFKVEAKADSTDEYPVYVNVEAFAEIPPPRL